MKNWQLLLIAAIGGAVLCFCAVMAWQQMFAPVEIPQDIKYIQERQKLELKAEADAAAFDSLMLIQAQLTDTIQILRQQPTQIHRNYENERANNWNLSNDSAITLWRARLAAEDTFRTRFTYGKLR